MSEEWEINFNKKEKPPILLFTEEGKVYIHGAETTDVKEICNGMMQYRDAVRRNNRQ